MSDGWWVGEGVAWGPARQQCGAMAKGFWRGLLGEMELTRSWQWEGRRPGERAEW